VFLSDVFCAASKVKKVKGGIGKLKFNLVFAIKNLSLGTHIRQEDKEIFWTELLVVNKKF